MKTLKFKMLIAVLIVILIWFFWIFCGNDITDNEESYPFSYLIVANADIDAINAVNITYNGITGNVLSGFNINYMEYILLYDTIEMTLDINITTADGDNVIYTNQFIPVNKALVIIQKNNLFTKELMTAAAAMDEGFDLTLAEKSNMTKVVSGIKTIGIRKFSK